MARSRTRLRIPLAIAGALLALQFVVLPLVTAGLAIRPARPHVPPAAALGLSGARDVTFPARDGVRLAGWYVPGRSGAAVLLTHGSHGSRADTVAHLRLLSAAGYAVLGFDARGHGASAGQTNAFGWKGAADVAGAFDFARRQPGIDPRRIAFLGLSMGAEEGLRAAAGGLPLRAVVADGARASTLGDRRLVSGSPLPVAVGWLSMRATEALSGESEPAPLASIVGRIRAPVLLIASNARDEYAFDRAYRQRIGPGARLWHVADAGHTRALARHPDAYAARVLPFLGDALG